MKALEILREIKNTYNESVVIGFTQKSININEAIKELEELNNRSCDGCKYESKKDCKGNFITVCKRFPRLTDRYETKDNK